MINILEYAFLLMLIVTFIELFVVVTFFVANMIVDVIRNIRRGW